MVIRMNFPMTNPPILGADISRYQAMVQTGRPTIHFNFDSFQEMGGRFIHLRAIVAAAGTDYELDYNVQQAESRNIPFTLYIFFKAWHSQPKQIADSVTVLQRYGTLKNYKGFMIDVEVNDGLSKTAFTGIIQKFAKNVKAGCTGFDPRIGIYTRGYFWNYNTYRNDWAKTLWLNVAHWFPGIEPYRVPSIRPYVPDDWAAINNPVEPTFWQFDTHDNGFQWGSRGDDEIDLNWFTQDGGTEQAFLKWAE